MDKPTGYDDSLEAWAKRHGEPTISLRTLLYQLTQFPGQEADVYVYLEDEQTSYKLLTAQIDGTGDIVLIASGYQLGAAGPMNVYR